MLKYKGYTGHAEFDDTAELFHGEVFDLRDVITFQGTSVEELEKEFRDPVDDYVELRKERGDNRAALRREDDGDVSGTVLLAKYLP